MSVLTPTLAQLRYRWTAESGAWAGAHQLWASRPGRRLVSVRSADADAALRIDYLGFPEGLTYVLPYLAEQQAVLTGRVTGTAQTPVSWRAARRPNPGADLVALGCSRRRALRLPTAHSVLLPFRVHQWLDIVGDAATMLRTVSDSERRRFGKLRRTHEWTTRIGTTEDDLRFFYERMHRPTMDLRHGDEARSADWEVALHALFRQGFLLFVEQGGKRVAGVLARLEDGGTTLRMRLLGVLDGDETHYRSGAVKAVYYLAMEWAADNGVRRIDFSGADPYPGKGVFQFKRRFHPTLELPRDHHSGRRVHLRVARDTPLVRDLLVATPMLTVDRADRLVAIHFHDDVRPSRSAVRGDGPGVHECRTVHLDEFLAGLPAADRSSSLLIGR